MAQSDKEFYRNILDNLTDGAYFADMDHQITYWNQRAEGISGYEPAEMTGRWGGEEFIAIVANVSEDLSFTSAAERLRSMVEESELHAGDSMLRSTISVCGSIVDEGDSADMIVNRADQLLYTCKDAGRNRDTCA